MPKRVGDIERLHVIFELNGEPIRLLDVDPTVEHRTAVRYYWHGEPYVIGRKGEVLEDFSFEFKYTTYENLLRAIQFTTHCNLVWNKYPKFESCFIFGPHRWTLTTSDHALSWEELRLEYLEALDKTRTRHEKLKAKFEGLAGNPAPARKPIPSEVRIFVWRRDEGKCVQCGSQENLEFDHIIPVVRGGANTERNIQLLCETCNRRKSHSIG